MGNHFNPSEIILCINTDSGPVWLSYPECIIQTVGLYSYPECVPALYIYPSIDYRVHTCGLVVKLFGLLLVQDCSGTDTAGSYIWKSSRMLQLSAHLVWQSPKGKRWLTHWESMLRWRRSISEYNLKNPKGIPTRSMKSMKWYSSSQVSTAKHVSYPQLTAILRTQLVVWSPKPKSLTFSYFSLSLRDTTKGKIFPKLQPPGYIRACMMVKEVKQFRSGTTAYISGGLEAVLLPICIALFYSFGNDKNYLVQNLVWGSKVP